MELLAFTSRQFAPKTMEDLSVRFIHSHFVQFPLVTERNGRRKPPAERSAYYTSQTINDTAWARHIISLFRSTSPWQFPLPTSSMETSMEEVGGSRFPWKFPWKLVEVSLVPWKLVEASTEVDGSFHCRWKWELSLLPSSAASARIYRGISFHQLPYTPTLIIRTSTYFHEYHT